MSFLYKAAIALVFTYMRVVFRPRAHKADGSVSSRFGVDTPSVLIANHTSHKDAILLLAAFRGKLSFLVAKDWYDKPQFKWLLKAAGGIPCNRFGLDTEWLREAVAAVKDGRTVMIFPEGRTRQDGEMNEFKSGFAMLSAMTGAPVVPIGISGRYKVFHRTHFVIGESVTLERGGAMNSQYLKDETHRLQGTVDSLRKTAKQF